MENRPQGRQKKVAGESSSISRRGSGLGTGPVGNREQSGQAKEIPEKAGNGDRKKDDEADRPKSPNSLWILAFVILVVLIGGGSGSGLISSLLGAQPQALTAAETEDGKPLLGSYGSSYWDSYGYTGYSGSSSSSWLQAANTGSLNSSVAPAVRNKRTVIRGNGRDVVTIMVYMCGTDLESQNGMATKDIQEMIDAEIGDNVNLILYTGGCRKWQNNLISSSTNQIYQVKTGGLITLKKDAGKGLMTSPGTLSSFIDFCADKFPANRNILILWDHGGGSISGFGYDEKSSASGAMTLGALDKALNETDVAFDIIGFDACLMGSLETGLTLADHADYLVASEETEPGLGWYYTNWLTVLSRNTSIPSTELGKRIIDDFVVSCARNCPGQETTLSLTDLAELQSTVPACFSAFSQELLSTLRNGGYRTVANVRSTVREFAGSTKVDQIDLVHMALKLDTQKSRALANSLLSAVKYNRVSSNIANAYGLSVYFPWQRMSTVNTAVSAYQAIGLDRDYADCIRTFASLEAGGQAAGGGSSNTPAAALNGQSYSSYSTEDLILDVLGQLFGLSDYSYYDRSLDLQETARFIAENRIVTEDLVWTDGLLRLSEAQWALVEDLTLNVFVDDGEGYIDLGLDNVFDFTEDGALIGSFDGTWLAIDGQPVAYYCTETISDEDHYAISGYVPVLLNGERAQLLLSFTDECPDGVIVGALRDYRNGETDTIAKSILLPLPGDTLDFVCDYYHYDGSYSDSYMIGQQHIFTGNEKISNVFIDASCLASYRISDIYNQHYWTPVIPVP